MTSIIFYSEYILDDDSEQPGAPDIVTDASASAPTPAHTGNGVDTIKNSFSWSMNFDDEDNPWRV